MSEQMANVKSETASGKRETADGLHSNAETNQPIETVTDASGANLSSHFTDEETGEVIEITEDFKNRAHEVRGFIRGSFYLLAEGLAAMADEKLYGAFGYTSFKKYCQEELDFGVRQAYKYAVIGRSVSPHLQLTDGDGEASTTSMSHLNKVGITKLNEIIRHAEDQVQQLINEGKISIGDQELTDEQLANKTVKQLRDQLKAADEKAARAELLEEQKKNLEMQNETLAEENEDLAGWKEQHRERAETQDEISAAIEECSLLAKQLNARLMNVKLQDMLDVATHDQRQDLVTLLDTVNDRATDQRKRFSAVIDHIYDEQMDFDDEAAIDNIISE